MGKTPKLKFNHHQNRTSYSNKWQPSFRNYFHSKTKKYFQQNLLTPSKYLTFLGLRNEDSFDFESIAKTPIKQQINTKIEIRIYEAEKRNWHFITQRFFPNLFGWMANNNDNDAVVIVAASANDGQPKKQRYVFKFSLEMLEMEDLLS